MTDLYAWIVRRGWDFRQIGFKVVIQEDCQPKNRLCFPIRGILISQEPRLDVICWHS